MEQFDIERWVDEIPGQLAFRQAVRTILFAISGTPNLKANMIMKGGILLALGYHGSRYTKDIDFSTNKTLEEFDIKQFLREFNEGLTSAVDQMDYGLDCVVQSSRQNPPNENAIYPTIQISVGYAHKGNQAAHKRLRAKNSSQVVRIDYSLNEPIGEPEVFEIEGGDSIRIYSFHDLMAEKFRAVLQQEVRNRVRRQDIFDLHFLLRVDPSAQTPATRARILASLYAKAGARGLGFNKSSMSNPEIIRRSKVQYDDLRSEIVGDLPPFDETYNVVRNYYENLPWDD